MPPSSPPPPRTQTPASPSVSLSVSSSHTLCISVFLPLSLCPSVSLSASVSLSPSLSSISLSPSLSFCLCPSFYLCLFHLPVSLFVSVSLSTSLSFHLCLIAPLSSRLFSFSGASFQNSIPAQISSYSSLCGFKTQFRKLFRSRLLECCFLSVFFSPDFLCVYASMSSYDSHSFVLFIMTVDLHWLIFLFISLVCNCYKNWLSDRRSCLNLYPCPIKFGECFLI